MQGAGYAGPPPFRITSGTNGVLAGGRGSAPAAGDSSVRRAKRARVGDVPCDRDWGVLARSLSERNEILDEANALTLWAMKEVDVDPVLNCARREYIRLSVQRHVGKLKRRVTDDAGYVIGGARVGGNVVAVNGMGVEASGGLASAMILDTAKSSGLAGEVGEIGVAVAAEAFTEALIRKVDGGIRLSGVLSALKRKVDVAGLAVQVELVGFCWN